MMHYLDEIDPALEAKLAVYLRARQADHGGWPLYHGGALDISCTVKAYYALKLAGDSPDAPHMARAREAILERGGAARANVFTRIALALFGQVPWRAVPYIPVEIMLLPRWFPFHLDKVSYWSRTVMVPLFILCTYKPRAKNPRNVDIARVVHDAARTGAPLLPSARGASGAWRRAFSAAGSLRAPDRSADSARRCARRATRRAENWILERLNGEDGLGAIFPAMVNALEAMVLLGYPRTTRGVSPRKRALEKLLVIDCDECLLPAVRLAGVGYRARGARDAGGGRSCRGHGCRGARARVAARRKQLLDEPGDWQVSRPKLRGGGWAVPVRQQLTTRISMTPRPSSGRCSGARSGALYAAASSRALDWLVGHAEQQRRVCGVRCRQHPLQPQPHPVRRSRRAVGSAHERRHGARGDGAGAAWAGRRTSRRWSAPSRSCAREQSAEGSWFGRWGTNYIYGTWSVLAGVRAARVSARTIEAVRRAVDWLTRRQNADGGWGESNDTYAAERHRAASGGEHPVPDRLGAAGADGCRAGGSDAVRARRRLSAAHATGADGLWCDPTLHRAGLPARVLSQVSRLLRLLPALGACRLTAIWSRPEPLIDAKPGRDRLRAGFGGAASGSAKRRADRFQPR